MELTRQEYWSGKLFLSPGDLPYPRIEPKSPALQADFLLSETTGRKCATLEKLLNFSDLYR